MEKYEPSGLSEMSHYSQISLLSRNVHSVLGTSTSFSPAPKYMVLMRRGFFCALNVSLRVLFSIGFLSFFLIKRTKNQELSKLAHLWHASNSAEFVLIGDEILNPSAELSERPSRSVGSEFSAD